MNVQTNSASTQAEARAKSVRPRIALIADGDPHDRNTMSGTPFYCGRALRRCGEVLPLQPGYTWWMSALRLANAPAERLTGYRYSRSHSTLVAQMRSRRFSRLMELHEADIAFSAKDCKGIAYLKTDKPVVYWTDATFRGIRGYYPEFSRLMGISIREGELLERRALERADHIIALSDWARGSIIEDYGIDESRVSAFPYGPKLDEAPPAAEVAARQIVQPLELLLVGGSWERKGGPLAVSILQELQRRGIEARLTVAGKNPQVNVKGIESVGFLNKNKTDGALGLNELYRRAHFFLMPVRQEAGGSVFLEATAHGLPCLTCRTGGVPALVRDGVSGHLFDVADGPEPYADLIEGYLAAPERYHALVQSTRRFFETEGNWTTWAARVQTIFSTLLR